MLPHRPSILQRPLVPESRAHQENAPIEYQRYQERLAYLQARAAKREQELADSLYPAPRGATHDAPQACEAGEDLSPQTRSGVETRFRRRNVVSGDRMEHPWNYGTPHDCSAEAREVASRAAARSAMQVNMEMMEAKRQAQAVQKSRDRNGAAVAVGTEESWWNRGAASEKWIPPEHRVRGKGAKAQANNSQGAADVFQWSIPSERPSTTQQRVSSSSSATPWAPYATSDNVPKPRQVAYRPTAPFCTSDDASASSNAPVSRRHTFSSSVRAPFASHDDVQTERPVTPPSRSTSAIGLAGSRPSMQSNLPPFDNDNQPAVLPPRPRIRMAPRAPSTCPYDTASEEKPQARTAPVVTFDTETSTETSSHQNSSGHQENRPAQSNTPTAGHAEKHASHQAPWRTTELSHTAAEERGHVTAYGGRGVNSAMHGYSSSPAPAQTSKEGHRQLPHYTRPEDAGREHTYAGQHVDDIMRRHPGEVLHTDAHGTFLQPSYTPQENAGRDHLLGGQDVNQLMHRKPGETVVTNARGTLDPMSYTREENVGREHMYAGERVVRVMHPSGRTVATNASGTFDMPQYTAQEDAGRDVMYGGDRVDRVMHPTGRALVTNAHGTTDMPQYTAQEDAARDAMYGGDRVDRAMHPTCQFVPTNARGTFVPATETMQEVQNRQHMYDSSGVNAALHMSAEHHTVNKEGGDEMPHYTKHANATRRAFYAGSGVGDALHADDGHRQFVATNKYGRSDLPQGTGFEEKGRKDLFYEDTVNSILHPVAEGRSSRRLSSFGEDRDAGLSDIAGFSTAGDKLQQEIWELSSKYNLT